MARAGLVLALLLASACMTHRVPVPPVRPEPPPGLAPLPVEVAWRLTPAAAAAERTEPGPGGQHHFTVPVGEALAACWAEALPRAFARPVPWAPGAPPPPGTATLEVDLEAFEVGFAWMQAPWSAGVAERAVLRDRDGGVVRAFALRGEAVRPLAFAEWPSGPLGEVTGAALRQAGEAFLRELPADERVRAWLAREGVAPPDLPPATAAPVRLAPPPEEGPPHRWGLWARLGPWFPPARNALLDRGEVGFLLGAGLGRRLTPWLTLQADLDLTWAQYSAESAPPAGFLVKNASWATLETVGLTLGPRLQHRLGSVELHAAAGLALLLTRLTLPQSLVGLPGEWVESGSAAGWAGALGLDWFIRPGTALGLEWRHLEASAGGSEIARGSLQAGGNAVGVLLRLYTP